VLTRRMLSGGELLLISVAQVLPADFVQLDLVVEAQLSEFLALLLPILMLAMVAGVVTIRRSLRPLGELARLAAAIGPMRTEVRLPVDGVPAEVLPLVTAVNGALTRLEDGFALQRRFTADAAHQLRTPLAVIAARLDSLTPFEGQPELKADVRRMSRLVGQLLAVARLRRARSTSRAPWN
jgi:signal transduction histidine kinase